LANALAIATGGTLRLYNSFFSPQKYAKTPNQQVKVAKDLFLQASLPFFGDSSIILVVRVQPIRACPVADTNLNDDTGTPDRAAAPRCRTRNRPRKGTAGDSKAVPETAPLSKANAERQ